jgi:hypothetical protein
VNIVGWYVKFTHIRMISVCMRWILTHMSVIMTCTSVIYTRRVQYLHAECDFLPTKSMISTRWRVISVQRVWFQHSKLKIVTHTSVIMTRKIVIYTRRVCLSHAEYDLPPKSVISTHMIRMTVTNTLTSVISTPGTSLAFCFFVFLLFFFNHTQSSRNDTHSGKFLCFSG